MGDVLDVYQRPYDPLRPVVCLDETNRQLIEKRSIPSKPGSPEREDYEYRRCGVADLFVAFEPLACKRVVKLTVSAPTRFCSFSANRKCRKMAGKDVQPLNNYTCRFRPSSLKQADKSGLDGLQTGK